MPEPGNPPSGHVGVGEGKGAPQVAPLVAVEAIVQRFPGVTALQDVSLAISGGEIVGLMGENGAGKSTLLKILSGAQQPTAGRILFEGRETVLPDPHSAQRLGIVTIHQELSVIPTLSVAENIFIGRAPVGRLGFVDWGRMNRDARQVTARVGLTVDPDVIVSTLSVAEQQLVEIARALSLNSRLIIMDEPTSALSEAEVSRLLDIMRKLRDDGVAVLFVTHRLDEASIICDRMVVLRDGRLAGHLVRKGGPIPIPDVIERMVGRAASELYRKPATRHAAGAVRLSVRGLATRANPAAPHAMVLSGIDLDLKAGEILGVAGLVGSGRTETARAIFGADPIAGGQLTLDGVPIVIRSPRDAIKAGIGLVPEDRKRQALFLALAIQENFTMAAMERYSRAGGFIDERRERQDLERYRGLLHIKMHAAEQAVSGLSGGNQQKVVLARWLTLSPKVLIVDEPTRGVDVGAKAEVHQILDQLAASGIAVMMISSELPEVLAVADRIVTMREGRVTGSLPASEATESKLMRLMTIDGSETRHDH